MAVKMADITKKSVIYREATASGRIRLRKETVERIRAGSLEKGDPIQIGMLAGINAAKLTPQIMLLCHPLKIENVDVNLKLMDDGVAVTSTVKAYEKTGVEMEALMATTAALLNVLDVVKKYEKDASGQYPHTEITEIRVVSKVKGSR